MTTTGSRLSILPLTVCCKSIITASLAGQTYGVARREFGLGNAHINLRLEGDLIGESMVPAKSGDWTLNRKPFTGMLNLLTDEFARPALTELFLVLFGATDHSVFWHLMLHS